MRNANFMTIDHDRVPAAVLVAGLARLERLHLDGEREREIGQLGVAHALRDQLQIRHRNRCHI